MSGKSILQPLLTGFVLAVLTAMTVMAQTTAFTYQGRLTDAGLPPTGNYDFQFTVSDEGGAVVAGQQRLNILVTNGVFNVSLDFGAETGSANSNGSGNTFVGYNAQGNIGGNNLTNAAAVGANAAVQQSNSLVLGSINGVNNATADTRVGIGTTTPKAKLDVTGGNILVGSPDGATCKILSIDNAGVMVLTAVACP